MWVQIAQFPQYFVDETGRIASVSRKQWKDLKQRVKGDGYCGVVLYQSGVRKDVFVHVLVAEAFLGSKPVGLEVNHKNGDKTDNRLSNLEYVTRSENIQHAYRTGLHPNTAQAVKISASRRNSGERNGKAKLTDSDAAEVLLWKDSKLSQQSVAKAFGVSQVTVGKIWNGKRRDAYHS